MCSWGPAWGFKGRLAARAGGSVSRAVARPERHAPTLSVALRRPALAVGRGVVARGRPPRRFFELLKSCLQKLVLAVSTTAAAALAPAVRSAEVRSDARLILAQVSTLTAFPAV